MGIVEDIRAKTDEIIQIINFIRTFVDIASTDQWGQQDPGLTEAKAIYTLARTRAITKVNELPTV